MRKSKQTRKSNVMKNKKSMQKYTRRIKHSNIHKNLHKKFDLAINNMEKISKQDPVIGFGDSIKLMKRSKKSFKKGHFNQAFLNLLTAVSVATSMVQPIDESKRIAKKYHGIMTDPQVLLEWHTDNKRSESNRYTRRRNKMLKKRVKTEKKKH